MDLSGAPGTTTLGSVAWSPILPAISLPPIIPCWLEGVVKRASKKPRDGPPGRWQLAQFLAATLLLASVDSGRCNEGMKNVLICSVLLLILTLMTGGVYGEGMRVYVGTYTRGKESKGIYLARLNLKTGVLSSPELVAEADNPSFLVLSPDERFLYAVEECGDYKGEKSGALRGFSVAEETGKLTALNSISTAGAAPCHLCTDSVGRNVYFANYTGGSAGAAPIGDDGSLAKSAAMQQHSGGSVTPRQKNPHAHSVNLDPAGRFAYVADLGLDKIMIYRIDSENGRLITNQPAFAKVAPGSGPRHFTFHPDGKFAYVINEINLTVTAFSVDPKNGGLTEIQTLDTVPKGDRKGFSTAHVEMHPSGRFLYGSNRGHNSIVVYSVDQESGKLALVEIEASGGKMPRNFGIDPTGRFLLAAGQNSDNIAVFRIDEETGALNPTGASVSVPSPVCIRFAHDVNGDYKPLFDGKTLEGWEGDSKWFRVEDGAVVAGSLKEKIPNNAFLVSKKAFGNFDLRFKARLDGEGKNAGVQFWSERIPNHHEVIGFQCDIGHMNSRSIWGALYDESRRRRMLSTVPLPTRAATKFDDWNSFRILALDNLISIWVNGALATRYFENEPTKTIPRRGRFGLQIHSGPPAEARYKDIMIREL